MLAYLFWHQPREESDRDCYEEALRRFHSALATPSWSFRVAAFPFGGGGGYEDWYLVDGWKELGELNAAAVDVRRAESHDKVAALSAHGWGAVYSLVGGSPEPLRAPQWCSKDTTQGYAAFLAKLGDASIWQRQLVLGPALEFCVFDPDADLRERVV